MYAKIASALLISATLMTPVVALAAGGNFNDPQYILSSGSGGLHVDTKGPLTIGNGEKVTAVWAFVYQPGTKAGQVYYREGLNITGPTTITWNTTVKHLLDGNFEPSTSKGPAWGMAIVFGSGGNLPWVWWDDFQLVMP